MRLLLLFTLLFSLSCLSSIVNQNASSFHRSLGSWKSLENGEVPAHFIPNTTRPNLPYVFKRLIDDVKGVVNISQLIPSILNDSIRHIDFKLNTTKAKLLEGINFKAKKENDLLGILNTDESLYDLVDIIIPILDDEDVTLNFLELWKSAISDLHTIIILAEGVKLNPEKIPNWLECIVYERSDIAKFLGADSHLIPAKGYQIRTFGNLISDRKIIFTIDPKVIPTLDENNKNSIIEMHVYNLMTPSTPDYFNTLYDPFRAGSDFTKGTPYSIRSGYPTAISHGLSFGENMFDSITNLVKKVDQNMGAIYGKTTNSIPFGVYFSMSLSNLAFNRETLGVIMFPGLIEDNQPMNSLGDILCGWIAKTIADAMYVGTKSGYPYVKKLHTRNEDDLISLLSEEFQGYFMQEEIYNVFKSISLPRFKDAGELFIEIAKIIDSQLSPLNSYFKRYSDTMKAWVRRWDNHHAFMSTNIPISSYSSLVGNRNVTCAVLTITHNEKIMLPLWARYYSKHVASPQDIYILDHNSNDGSTSKENLVPGVTLRYLHGDKAGFPLSFMNRLF